MGMVSRRGGGVEDSDRRRAPLARWSGPRPACFSQVREIPLAAELSVGVCWGPDGQLAATGVLLDKYKAMAWLRSIPIDPNIKPGTKDHTMYLSLTVKRYDGEVIRFALSSEGGGILRRRECRVLARDSRGRRLRDQSHRDVQSCDPHDHSGRAWSDSRGHQRACRSRVPQPGGLPGPTCGRRMGARRVQTNRRRTPEAN